VNPYVWILLRVLNGVGLVILYTIIESWLNRQTPSENRGRVFAIYMTVNLGSIALAQQLLTLDKELTFLLFAVSSMAISLSLIPITWTKLKQPEVHDVARVSVSMLYRAAPVAVFSAFLSGLVMGAFWGLGPLYAHRIGLTTEGVALFISLFILGGALLQFPLGRISDNSDRRKVIAYVTTIAALTALIFIFLPKIPWLIHGFALIYGGLVFAIYPIAVAHLVDNLEPKHMLAGGSSMLLLHGSGAMVGPLLTGQLIEWLGASSLLAFWSIVLAILAILTRGYLISGEDEDPSKHHADFVPMVRTTPSALEMLPQESDDKLHDPAPVWGSHDTEEPK
jgi:MFS family permease